MPDCDGSQSSSSKVETLLRQAAGGDAAARAELLALFRSQLKRMVSMRMDRRVAARFDASDIVQETLKDAHNRLPEYFADPQLPFYPWLRRIAWDRLVDMYRSHIGAERRSVLREQSGLPKLNDESTAELANSIVTSSSNPVRRAMLAEMSSRTKSALLQLKPHDREILVLRYLEQLTVEEIAGVLGISQTAVTSRHLRALQRLRRLLGDEFGGS
ncbi:MAG: sigma-70 family RNA polymerase sigma factor [Pirellulales bacterium]